MEESETNEAPLNRTSPRIKREKSSPQDKAIYDINDGHTVEVQRNKRKKVSKDAKPKQNVGFKCSVVMLKSLIDRLSPDQCQWIRDCGFGALLDIRNCKLPKRLTLWLINKFNYHTGALGFHGMSIPIKPLIQKLLALPAGDIPVTAPLFTVAGKTKVLNPNAEQREFRDDKGGRGKALHLVIDDLIACHVQQKFQRTFLLVVFCIYLAPTSSHLINRNYLECLNNMEEVAWNELV
ncbi:hypothetical protein BRADI_4g07551v3 [Brachypodium distachyon]|uniref:Aminotransferase-like plant mobile domain-containing protein n=1 Tax=Brachypodium distachyon TaxID=15368 RepID=A0A0Q3EGB3_BRADI|nr:hypothetical protein BRADI_4g07551v3 [Brachypodium distachyon]